MGHEKGIRRRFIDDARALRYLTLRSLLSLVRCRLGGWHHDDDVPVPDRLTSASLKSNHRDVDCVELSKREKVISGTHHVSRRRTIEASTDRWHAVMSMATPEKAGWRIDVTLPPLAGVVADFDMKMLRARSRQHGRRPRLLYPSEEVDARLGARLELLVDLSRAAAKSYAELVFPRVVTRALPRARS